MLFNSLQFAIFLPVVFGLFWLFFHRNTRLQNLFLLVVSYIFYGWWDWRFLFLIALSSIIDYSSGLGIDNSRSEKQRKAYLWLSLVSNLGMLGVFKYFNFFSHSLQDAFSTIGIELDAFTLDIVLPVGISFYTFQTLSYTIDVYRNQLKPTRDVIAFFAYVSFFPQLVAGPIERAINLLPQFYAPKKFSYPMALDGLRQILYGFFKKLVVADNCAVYVNQIFANYQEMSGLELTMGSVLFAFQIYGDFSGYSDIAIGTAKLFGFNLMTNFATPYFSRDIAEFWRRWHISLTTWFRDYVYIPLGGSRSGLERTIANTFIVFLVSGFWHGANWTFIVWGLLNALYFMPLLLRGKNRSHLNNIAENGFLPSFRELFGMVSTFALTCLAWVFFRAESVSLAIDYIGLMFGQGFFPKEGSLVDWNMGPVLFVFIFFDWLGRKSGFAQFVGTIRNTFLRRVVYYFILCMILLYGEFNETAFIYFQF